MKLSRREVLKAAAASSAVMAIGGPLSMVNEARAASEPDEWVKSVCRFCGTG